MRYLQRYGMRARMRHGGAAYARCPRQLLAVGSVVMYPIVEFIVGEPGMADRPQLGPTSRSLAPAIPKRRTS